MADRLAASTRWTSCSSPPVRRGALDRRRQGRPGGLLRQAPQRHGDRHRRPARLPGQVGLGDRLSERTLPQDRLRADPRAWLNRRRSPRSTASRRAPWRTPVPDADPVRADGWWVRCGWRTWRQASLQRLSPCSPLPGRSSGAMCWGRRCVRWRPVPPPRRDGGQDAGRRAAQGRTRSVRLRCRGARPRRITAFVTVTRPNSLSGLDGAIGAGALRLAPALGLWTQPGLFSWDRLDPGSALLMRSGEPLIRRGGGRGVRLRGAVAGGARRAAAVSDGGPDRHRPPRHRRRRGATWPTPAPSFHHADARDAAGLAIGTLDFAVVNPPFHAAGREDRGLGQGLVAAAAKALRRGGVCRDRRQCGTLPYEAAMAADFSSVRLS